MQNQGDRDVARFFLGVEQEVRVQVDFAVVLDVEAGAGLKVGQAARVGQLDVEEAADPGANLGRRGDEVDPDRFEALQVGRRVDHDLAQTPVTQFEGADRGLLVAVVAVADEVLAHFVGENFEQ